MISALRNDKRIIAPLGEKDAVRKYSRAGLLQCPVCGQQVIFRAGDKKIWHFAHKRGAADCSISKDPDYRPESQEHQIAKTLIYTWLTAKFPSCDVGMEVHIAATNQFADVLLEAPDGRIAFELQYSRLTGETWRTRSSLYESAGIADVWLLIGKNQGPAPTEPEAEMATVPLNALAKAILLNRGQVYFLDMESLASDLEKSQLSSSDTARAKAEGRKLTAVSGIADHYHVDNYNLQGYLADLKARPIEQQHRWFSKTSLLDKDPDVILPWSKKDFRERTYDVKARYVYASSLKSVDVKQRVRTDNDAGCPSSPVLVGSGRHKEAMREGWEWEKANHEWHSDHPARVRRRKVLSTKRSRHQKMLVGRGVASALPKLYPELLQLAYEGREELSVTHLRQHPAIPKPVRKWSTANWSPLTNIELPLEWVFGCHRQLWQMVVYCYCFCQKYIKAHLMKYDLKPVVSGRVFTGFALKVLANELSKELKRLKPSERVISRINQWVGGRMLEKGYVDDPLKCHLSTHSLRHVVISLYFDKLCAIGLLANPVSTEQAKLADRVALYLKQLHPLTQGAFARNLTDGQHLLIGERWLQLVREIHTQASSASQKHYSLRVSFMYPFNEDQETRMLTKALRANDLRVHYGGVYSGGELITSFHQKRK